MTDIPVSKTFILNRKICLECGCEIESTGLCSYNCRHDGDLSPYRVRRSKFRVTEEYLGDES